MDPAPHAGGERRHAFPEAIEADLLARADKNHMAIQPRREQGRQLAPETTLPQPGGVPHGKGHDLLPFRQFAVPETESAGGGRSEKLRVHTLPQYGISTTFVDVFDLDEVRAAVQENTKAIYIETLGNPNSDVVDIEALAKIAHENKIPLVVDNTFATPYLVRPIEYGADIVVHSATKFIGGHGTTLGGVIVDSGKFDWEGSGKFASLTEPNPSYHGISFTKAVGPAAFVTKVRAILLRDTGATLSPFNSFLLLQGLETLSLRVERHVENALKVVKYLESQPQVEKVHHPSVSDDPKQQALYAKYFPNGGGSIFTFEIKGDAQKAKDFIDNLELFSLLANVADVKSLVIHPATTTHGKLPAEAKEAAGIREGLIRLSVGLEDIDDIIRDISRGLDLI